MDILTKYFFLSLIIILFLIVFSISAYAVVLNPSAVTVTERYNIKASVWYEGTTEPVTNAIVNYVIISGTNVDCKLQTYPTNQKLNWVSDEIYCSGSDCNVESGDPSASSQAGDYTVCVRAIKTGFKTDYGKATLTVYSDIDHCSSQATHTPEDESVGQYRHYFTTAWNVEDCTAKQSENIDDSGYEPLVPGYCRDYITCSNKVCNYTDLADTCSGNTLKEYYISGATCTFTNKNCEEYETNYCDITTGDVYRNEWQCSGTPGACSNSGTKTLVQDCSNTCTDTDGSSVTTKGTITDNNLCSAGQTSCPSPITKTDECINVSTVREYTCSGNDYSSQEFNCGNLGSGYVCQDGKCIQITNPDFTITADPNSLSFTLPTSGSTSQTSTITISSLNNFNSPVSLSGSWVGTSPTGIIYSYNPSSVTPPKNGQAPSTLNVTVSSAASTGTFTLRTTGTSGSLSHDTDVTISVISGPPPTPTPICSYSLGAISFSPSSTVQPNTQATASSNFGSECSGKSLQLRKDTCSGTQYGSSCTVTGAGSCSVSFNSPSSPGDYDLVFCEGVTSTQHKGTLIVTEPCKLISASISSLCSGDCDQGEKINMTATISGDCSSANVFQIDAHGSCEIEYASGDMSGITGSVTIGPTNTFISSTWTIPSIPSECKGKTISPTAAGLWQGTPGTGNCVAGACKGQSVALSGSFKFSTISPSDEFPSVSASHQPDPPSNLDLVTYTATATDNNAVKSIGLFVDNVNVTGSSSCTITGTSGSCIYTGGPYSGGSTHTYYATATDNVGQTSTSIIKSFAIQTIEEGGPGWPGIIGACNNNNICEEGETQRGCSSDCYTTVTIWPKTMNPGQEAWITIEFNDSQYEANNDMKLILYIDDELWSYSYCKISGLRMSPMMPPQNVKVISLNGYARVEITCIVPSKISGGEHMLKAIPVIY